MAAGGDDLHVATTLGVLERQHAVAGVVAVVKSPQMPMLTIDIPDALTRTTSWVDGPALGDTAPGASVSTRAAACHSSCATRPVAPEGGWAQSPMAWTCGSSGLARSSVTTMPRSTVRPARRASIVSATVPQHMTKRSAAALDTVREADASSRPRRVDPHDGGPDVGSMPSRSVLRSRPTSGRAGAP